MGASDIGEEIVRDPSEFMSYCRSYLSSVIVQPLLRTLPRTARETLRDIVVGTLPTRVVNAHALRSPEGEPLVIIDEGLMWLMHFAAELHAVANPLLSPFSSSKSPADDAILFRLRGFKELLQYFRTAGHISLPALTWAPREASQFANLVAHTAETFVVAHELAHVFARHLDAAMVEPRPLAASNSLADFYQLSRQQEFEADAIGWSWFQNSWRQQGMPAKLGQEYAWLPLFTFYVLHLVEQNSDRPDPYSTHPPALQRMEKLVDTLRGRSREAGSNLLYAASSLPDFRQMPQAMHSLIDGISLDFPQWLGKGG